MINSIQPAAQFNARANRRAIAPPALSFALPNIRATLPPQFQRAFDGFVLACKRVLYDPKTHVLMQRQMMQPAPLPQKLAQGVAGLVLLVYMKAKDGGDPVPAPVLIPAAIELVGDTAQFLAQAIGQPVDQASYKAAVALVTAILGKKMGIAPRQFAQGSQTPSSQPRGPLPPQQAVPPNLAGGPQRAPTPQASITRRPAPPVAPPPTQTPPAMPSAMSSGGLLAGSVPAPGG
jgi:hypothetical protein